MERIPTALRIKLFPYHPSLYTLRSHIHQNPINPPPRFLPLQFLALFFIGTSIIWICYFCSLLYKKKKESRPRQYNHCHAIERDNVYMPKKKKTLEQLDITIIPIKHEIGLMEEITNEEQWILIQKDLNSETKQSKKRSWFGWRRK
ncbi:hypothetical protein AMTRI_Chr04g251480 [Amborella trichopoda]